LYKKKLYWFKSTRSYIQSQQFNLRIVGSTSFTSYYNTINSWTLL